MLLEKCLRLIYEMGIEIPTQVVFNLARHSNQNAPLKKKKCAADKTCTQDLERGDGEPRPGYLNPVSINGMADNDGNIEIENNAGHNTGDAKRQFNLIRNEVARKFS